MSYTQNFDGVGAPTLPSDFTCDSGYATTATLGAGLTAPSSPNVLTMGLTGAFKFATYNTADSNGGDVTVSAKVAFTSQGSHKGRAALAARGNSAALSTGGTFYAAVVDINNAQVWLEKRVSGTLTVLAGAVNIALATGVFYQPTFSLVGTTLQLTVRRLSDNFWLTSAGTFQAGAATAISIADGSISGSGYVGVYGANDGGSDAVYFDDFVLGNAAATSSGTMARAEGGDAGAFVGTCLLGSMAATEHGDAGAMAASVATGHLTRQDGGDVGSLAATFAGAATAFLFEQGDVGQLAGNFKAGVLARAERRDVGSFAGRFAAVATMAAAGRPDVGSFVALAHNDTTLAAIEGRDVAALAGSTRSSAVLRRPEGRDLAAMFGATRTTAALAAAEARDRGAILATAAGIPPSFKVKEAGDVAAMFGGTPTVSYLVYENDGLGGDIDYATPIASVANTTYTTTTLHPGTWMFGVRAQDRFGIEQNIDARVTIILDALGNDITNRPAPPTGLRAFAMPGGAIRVEWGYPATLAGPTVPTAFDVYATPGDVASYGAPAAVVPYAEGLFGTFRADIAGLADGVLYTVGVRAANASGEEPNTRTVAVVADASGPLPVSGLTGIAVV